MIPLINFTGIILYDFCDFNLIEEIYAKNNFKRTLGNTCYSVDEDEDENITEIVGISFFPIESYIIFQDLI